MKKKDLFEALEHEKFKYISISKGKFYYRWKMTKHLKNKLEKKTFFLHLILLSNCLMKLVFPFRTYFFKL